MLVGTFLGLVRAWIRQHNQTVKTSGGVRILVCHLPVKSPWLNPIEPKWVHGKRAIVEPERVLTAAEVRERVCDYFNCQQLPLLQREREAGEILFGFCWTMTIK